jgi:EF-P beta-lysylation protein EpmB
VSELCSLENAEMKTIGPAVAGDDHRRSSGPTPPSTFEGAASQSPSWRQIVKEAVRRPAELCRRLRLAPEMADRIARAAGDFPLFVPEPFLERMRPGDLNDPLLRQVLPDPEELSAFPDFAADPVADANAVVVPGLLRKYASRALLVATGACAVHCRYCFRRHFPYGELPKGVPAWEPALEAIAADESLREIILSGGDPLMLDDDTLSQLVHRLAQIPHLRRLRVHTRVPVMIPQRVTDGLISWLKGTRLAPWMVIHANHPREIDTSVAEALTRLVDAGVPVLNQAVLLGGVNDSADVLAELCERLVDLRVMPYYLHQLDRVQGAAHFEVPVETGLAIVRELRTRLPGYAVPRYVQEVPGALNKVVIG